MHIPCGEQSVLGTEGLNPLALEAAGQFTLLAGLYKNTFPLKLWEERLRVKPGMGLQLPEPAVGSAAAGSCPRDGGEGQGCSRRPSAKAFLLGNSSNAL